MARRGRILQQASMSSSPPQQKKVKKKVKVKVKMLARLQTPLPGCFLQTEKADDVTTRSDSR